ncbi:MAG TPA: nitroreductase family protein [Treponemataceae bacterium]|nr:nitroreductase family protein [Treponemataceae bacterium]
MATFLDLVKKRSSVRSYDSRTVEQEKLENCIEAARLAPSACNAQPWKFTIVRDTSTIQKIAAACLLPGSSMNTFVKDAPIIIAVTGESPNITSTLGSFIKRKKLFLIDIGIAAEHFCLQAADQELGTCMLGWFNERKIKRILSIPSRKRLYMLITLGYPKTAISETPPAKNRKHLAEMSCFEEYR